MPEEELTPEQIERKALMSLSANLNEIGCKISQMKTLCHILLKGEVAPGIPFTTGQITDIKAQYNVLKTECQEAWTKLP